MDEIAVTRNDEQSQYEIRVGDALAGFAEFRLDEDDIRFTHTEVDPAFQGTGVAGQLAEKALRHATARGETIVPLCPYIARYLRTHEIPGASIRWPEHPER